MTGKSQDLNDAGVLEDAALVLLRRYPGTRPDSLEGTIANLQWITRAIRRLAAPAPATATETETEMTTRGNRP